ncbi:MAG: class I SAM-dependent methyltransferase [Thermoplasmata archaeon]
MAHLEFFDSAYEGTPPWDIGRPQSEFVRLEEAGSVGATVLDVGCGTGENTLYLAKRGHEAWGVDSSPRAIEKAKSKSRRRGIPVTFLVADALRLDRLGRSFGTVIDSGLFHTFSDPDRLRFLDSLASVLPSGGSYFVLVFSEQEPADWGGPRRISQEEIRATFRDGWTVESIQPAKFESNIHPNGGLAWLSAITRL